MPALATRLLALSAALFLVCVFVPADVYGHGGQFRGPGDQVPPGLRDPADPTPPPPPPPPTPSDGPPTPVTPPSGPAGPVTPGTTPPPTTTPLGGGTRRRTAPTASFHDWVFWYHHNKEDIENLKWALYHPLSSENPLFQLGGRNAVEQSTGRVRRTQAQVRAQVIPALLWAMDPENADHADIEGAAYIALAKVAHEPVHVDRIKRGLDLDAKRKNEVLDSAALALGLLRRAEEDEQFTPRELDKARDALFDVFVEPRYPARTRGFAVISIGLLGDQPTGSGEWTGDAAGAARATTARLFELLTASYATPDLYVAVMTAIGLQPHDSVTAPQRDVLAECALKGRLHGRKPDPIARAHAALALGRIGGAADIRTLQSALQANKVDVYTRRSAAIGLGLLGRLVSGDDRVRAAEVLIRGGERVRDAATRNFALISLAYLLAEDAKAGRTDVLSGTRASQVLLSKARKSPYLEKGFAALAIALVLRKIDDGLAVDAWQEFRLAGYAALRQGASNKALDGKTRAAFCTGLGIAGDVESRERLRCFVADEKNSPTLRSYAALGLGLIQQPTREVSATIANALRERSSEELRRQTATALGLFGNPKIPGTKKDAVEYLVDELRMAQTQSLKGQLVLALARVGDHRALDELVRLLRDPQENPVTRALACAGLGLIGDLEWIPSLARGSKNINYLASNDTLREFLTIL